MRFLVSIFLVLYCYSNAIFCQPFKLDWAKQITGSSYDVCQAITLDNNANVYATGYFSSTVDFDPGPNTYNLNSVGAEDIFISKSDSNGNLIWAKSMGEFRYQAGYAITLDENKNIYVTGIFFGTVDFDPGPAVSNLTSAGNEDIFICKLDNNDNFIWAKRIGGSSNDYCNAIVIDKQDNICINGYFDGTSDFDPSTGIFNLTTSGQTDIFVCKLNNNGNLIWVKQIGGMQSESAYSIALDEQDNIYSTGFFLGTADFDPGISILNLQSNGFGDGFILKLSSNGNYIKAVQMGGNEKVRNNFLKFDKGGYIYITGYFDGDADFDPSPASFLLNSAAGDEDIFIAKYSIDIDLIWAKQIKGNSFQKGLAVDVDGMGNVYTTGYFNGTADFNPGVGEYMLTSGGDPNVFVCKLTANGDFVWAAQSKGAFFSGAYSLKIDLANNIYIAGTFEGITDFDPSEEQYNLTSAGQSEIFMQKIKQCTNVAIINTLTINTCTAYTLNNRIYNTSGLYTQNIVNSFGCDSVIIKLNLTINRIEQTRDVAICQNQFWLAGGVLQNTTGTYYDTLQSSSGCDSVVKTNLTVHPIPKPSLGNNSNICEGDTAILNPGNFSSYMWQDFTTASSYKAFIPGTYKVTVSNQYNCTASAVLTIKKIVPKPKNFLPANLDLCKGNILNIPTPNFKSYLWSDGSTASTLNVSTPGIYNLIVTNFDNCIGKDTIIIKEINCVPIAVPNAFTPNNDGYNDTFSPIINEQVFNYSFKIFNRFGQLIFQTNSINKRWDGTFKNQLQTAATYIYQIGFFNINQKYFNYTGNIILIR